MQRQSSKGKRLRRLLEQLPLQQLQRRKRQAVHSTIGWRRNSFQRKTRGKDTATQEEAKDTRYYSNHKGKTHNKCLLRAHTQHFFTHQSRYIAGQTSQLGGESSNRLVEDERTAQRPKTSGKPWPGWANFEEHQEFPRQLESDDEEQQQGTKAK